MVICQLIVPLLVIVQNNYITVRIFQNSSTEGYINYYFKFIVVVYNSGKQQLHTFTEVNVKREKFGDKLEMNQKQNEQMIYKNVLNFLKH